MSASISSLPIVSVGAYQTPFVNSAITDQSLIQFNPGPATTPSATWTYFFSYIQGILKLNQYLFQNNVTAPYATPSSMPFSEWSITANTIILAIISTVKSKFYNDPDWSSSIQGHPGWASDNSVNAYNSQLIMTPDGVIPALYSSAQTLSPNSLNILYFLVYAMFTETTDGSQIDTSSQTNKYTYNYIVSTLVGTLDFDGNFQLITVAEWFTLLKDKLNSVMGDIFLNETFSKIVEIIAMNPSSALDLVDRISPYFKLVPYTTSSTIAGSASSQQNFKTNFLLSLICVLLGFTYNTLTMQNAGYLKWRVATDAGFHVFLQPSIDVNNAFTTVETLTQNLFGTIVSSTVDSSPLSAPSFWESISFTTVSSRHGQVDGNRIPGVLVPNLKLLQQRLQSVYFVAGQIETLPLYSNYSIGFQEAISNIRDPTNGVLGAAADLQSAIDEFFTTGQDEIHYARWQAYLTVN